MTDGYTYNKSTGVYTYKPENVDGNWYARAHFYFGRAIDKNKYWSFANQTLSGYNRIIYLAAESGATESSRCVINSYNELESLSIKYQKGDLTIAADGILKYQHSESSLSTYSNKNVYGFIYGLRVNYKLPWQLYLATDIKMYSRRGLDDSSMNTNNLIWNASLSRSFMKDKITCKLDAFDILHQMSQIQYNITSSGNTSTWNNCIPRYVMLHLAYKISIMPKKK